MKFSLKSKGFTIIELLVSMSIVMILMVVLFQMVNQTSQIWKYTSGKSEQFRSARAAFDSITRQLSQATLNTYWDYDRGGAGNTLKYVRQSELRFICGPAERLISGFPATDVGAYAVGHAIFFQAPLGFVESYNSSAPSPYEGLDNLLNTWGYFIKFGNDQNLRPSFIGAEVPIRERYRLMEFMQSSDKMTLYYYTSPPKSLASSGSWAVMSDIQRLNAQAQYRNYTGTDWFAKVIESEQESEPVTHVLAENVVALVFEPKLSQRDIAQTGSDAKLAPQYFYDSTDSSTDLARNPKNQLPPIVRVTMVALDEASAQRLAATGDQGLGVDDLFKFANNYEADLQRLQDTLNQKNLKYRIFATDVSIRGAKWSRN